MRSLILSAFLYVVPGVLALGFGATYIYLLINEKTVPEGLDTVPKMIIGYFFGAGAATIQQTSGSDGPRRPPAG